MRRFDRERVVDPRPAGPYDFLILLRSRRATGESARVAPLCGEMSRGRGFFVRHLSVRWTHLSPVVDDGGVDPATT